MQQFQFIFCSFLCVYTVPKICCIICSGWLFSIDYYMFLFLHQYLRYQVVENVVLDDFRIYFTINLELTFFFVCLVCCFFCVFKRFFYEVICNSLVEKPHWKYPFSKNRSVKPILFVLDIMEISEHILTDWLIRRFHRSRGIRPCHALLLLWAQEILVGL